ncbi:MAG: bifunctional oligoribonuclease/PAP phosphatase NrnA [Candidatus Hodarchaeota archaeon]
MLKSKFENLLTFINNKNILITTHDLVDIDGLVSCYTLKFFFNQYFKDQEISIYFSGLSKPTENYLKNFNAKFPDFDFSYEKSIDFVNIDILVIVDTNNLNQIKLSNNLDILHSNIPYIFIDHHYKSPDSKNSNKESFDIVYENYSSTVEIILELFEIYKIQLTLPLKVLNISAILTDTGFFKYANNKSIQNVSNLLCTGIDIQEIYLLLQNDIDISEKIANIKGLQRVELIREGEYLIGITNVSSFGASVASMLIKAGFDIGIVVSKEFNQQIINTRAKKEVCIKTGLNLGKILEEISERYQCSGGGHDGAASLTFKIEVNIIIQEIIEKLKEYL